MNELFSFALRYLLSLCALLHTVYGLKEAIICQQKRNTDQILSCGKGQSISIENVLQTIYSDVIMPNSSCCSTVHSRRYKCSFETNSTSIVQERCDRKLNSDSNCTVKIPDAVWNISPCVHHGTIRYSCQAQTRDPHLAIESVSIRTEPKNGGLQKCSSDNVCEPEPGTLCKNKTVNTTEEQAIDNSDYIVWIVVGAVVLVLILFVVIMVYCILKKCRIKAKGSSRRPDVGSSNVVQNGGLTSLNYADIAFESENVVISNYSDISVTYASVNNINRSANLNTRNDRESGHDDACHCPQTSTHLNRPADEEMYDHMPGRSANATLGYSTKDSRNMGDKETLILPKLGNGILYDHIPQRTSEFCDNLYDKTYENPASAGVEEAGSRVSVSISENSTKSEVGSTKLGNVDNTNGTLPNSITADSTYDRLECTQILKQPKQHNLIDNNKPIVPPKILDRSNGYSLEDLTRHNNNIDRAASPGYEYVQYDN